jgi:hypothetical protein
VEACRLSYKGFADAGLSDQEHRARIVEPLQTVEFFDLRFGDRATGREVDVLERRPQSELGRFDAIAGLSFLPIIALRL